MKISTHLNHSCDFQTIYFDVSSIYIYIYKNNYRELHFFSLGFFFVTIKLLCVYSSNIKKKKMNREIDGVGGGFVVFFSSYSSLYSSISVIQNG